MGTDPVHNYGKSREPWLKAV